jgi:NAD(P)H-hydrate epimerase
MQPFTLTRAQVRELDRRAAKEYGVPGIVLMENAGRACAELLMRLNPTKKPTVVLCGPGNNGGDGFVIARHLDNNGWPVGLRCCHVGRAQIDRALQSEGRLSDALSNYLVAAKTKLPNAALDGVGSRHPTLTIDLMDHEYWVVDAIFGTGLSRPVGAPFDDVIAAVNAYGKQTLAVDIPTGLDCDTGEPLGPTIRASHTATFIAPKKGFLNPNGKKWIGEVHVVDIGVPRILVDQYRT